MFFIFLVFFCCLSYLIEILRLILFFYSFIFFIDSFSHFVFHFHIHFLFSLFLLFHVFLLFFFSHGKVPECYLIGKSVDESGCYQFAFWHYTSNICHASPVFVFSLFICGVLFIFKFVFYFFFSFVF